MWMASCPDTCKLLLTMNDGTCCEVDSIDILDETEKLILTTVELDNPDEIPIPCMPSRGTKMRVGKVKGHRNRADMSNGDANESRGQTDASMVLNTNEMAAVGDGDDTSAKSDAGDAKHDVDATDGLANQSDMSRGCRDMPGIHNSMHMTANVKGTIGTHVKAAKM